MIVSVGGKVPDQSRPVPAATSEELGKPAQLATQDKQAWLTVQKGVETHHDLPQRTGGAVERPASFHSHGPIGDHEANRNRGAQIEDALLNDIPVENVFRPSISGARNYAKHVLHTKRDARPVMGFYFWHRHQEIRFQHSPNVRFRTGIGSYFDVYTAQTSLLQQQQTYVDLRVNQMTSNVQLIEALGGGWDVGHLPSVKEVAAK